MSAHSQLNTQSYSNTMNKLSGGKRRRSNMRKQGRRRSRRYSRRQQRQQQQQQQEQQQKQNGGFFPGIGEVVSQAIVPFGLYAVQHKFKSRKNGSPANYSLKKFKKFKFTRRV
jgi:hypothetical protein